MPRQRPRRPWSWLAAFWLLAGLATGTPAAPIRMALSQSPLSLPVYVAEREGYFAAEGVQVRIDDLIGGHRALQQVLEGRAELATCSEAVVMFNSFARRDYTIVATFVASDDDSKIVTREDTGITRAQQLAGRRVGTVVGAASQYYLDTLLLLNGVDPATVEVRNLQPEAMGDALARREVDAIAIWEPFPFKAMKSVPGARLLPKSGGYVTTFNLVAGRSAVDTRSDDIVRLLRALDRAERFIAAEPARAQAVLRDRLGLDQAFIDWIWPRYSYSLTLDQSLVKTLEGEARWARREGHVKGDRSPNYLDFIDPGLLRRVRPSAVSIVE